jgi:hypothetical protein
VSAMPSVTLTCHPVSMPTPAAAVPPLEPPLSQADQESRQMKRREVFYSVWLCYDDFHSHPLLLTDGEQLDFKRCILFLHSDNEFDWPSKRSRVVDYLRRVADDLTGRRFKLRRVKPEGDKAVWPFFRREDYDRALECPRLLRGIAEPDGESNGLQPARRVAMRTSRVDGPRR